MAVDPSPLGPVADLLALLDLKQVDTDRFRVHDPGTWPGGAMFGGQLAAQALRAAASTVTPDQHPHSLHTYYLRGGRVPGEAEFAIQRLRDGASFSTREVTVSVEGGAIATVIASFHVGEPGPEFQLPSTPTASPESYPRPEGLADLLELRGIDVREAAFGAESTGPHPFVRRSWMRVVAPLPDDPLLHACLVVFLTDIGAHSVARLPVVGPLPRKNTPGVMSASIDHSVWLHRDTRADDWILYDLHALTNQASRGVSRGVLHDRAGELVASMCQEVLIRRLRPEG